jgi:hypothetical protein
MRRILFVGMICVVFSQIGNAQVKSDSVLAHVSDSIDNEDEEVFQSGLDTLFAGKQYFDLDTCHWNNCMINSGHFDSGNWKDTVRIVLVDSCAAKYFVPPFKNYLTCNFGWRRWIWHYGVDIKLQKGDTVCSAFDGIVRVTKYDKRGYGRVVVVRHPYGLETIYGHLSQEMVLPNQKIKAGDVIGLGGNSGRSTGSHLHFEIRYYGEPVDPNDIIDFTTYTLKHDTLVLTHANFEYLAELRKMKWTTVRKGDTLGHIAIRCHTTVTKLCQLNHIKRTTLLSIGRKLRYQ